MNESGHVSGFRVEDFNASVDLTYTEVTSSEISSRVTIFLLCFLGLPGNLFVIAVYLRQMTTSTRVYVFALGVVDSVTCLCGVTWSVGLVPSYTSRQVLMWFGYLSVLFSVLLLTFVSVERLLAVRHPHTFTLSAPRAKKALVVIAVVAAVCSTATVAPKHILRRPVSAERYIPPFVALSSIIFMIVCYTLVIFTLIKNASIARSRVSVIEAERTITHAMSNFDTNSVRNAVDGTSCNLTTTDRTSTDRDAVDRRAGDKTATDTISADRMVLSTTPMTTKLADTYKNVSLLFLITVVFIACWLPQFLSFYGVALPLHVRLVFLLNSGINPFVYTMASSMFRNDVRNFCRQTRTTLVNCRC